MFLLALLGTDPIQNLAKYKTPPRCVLIQLTKKRHCYYAICEHKTNDVQGHGPSNINLSLIVCFCHVNRPTIPSHFPLLTMSLFIPK